MKRIRKVSGVIPTRATLIDGYSNSDKDGFTANYINEHSVVVSPTEPVTDRKKVWMQHSDNLYNKSTNTADEYFYSDGTIGSSTSFCITDFIPVESGEQYMYEGLTNTGIDPYSIFYDSNKSMISSFKQQIGTNVITIPSNVAYVRFSIRVQYGDDNSFIFKTNVQDKLYILKNNDVYEEFIDGSISGSNENGNYIKYADGTMICYGELETASIAIGTAWGSLYMCSQNDSIQITYPVAFTNEPSLSLLSKGSNSAFFVNWTSSSDYTTKSDKYVLVRGNTAGAQKYKLQWQAIGRWK